MSTNEKTDHNGDTSQALPKIEVYNTLSKRKEEFVTVQPGHVGMYLCGPTVYKPSHIGHMVGPVIFDTVKRYLEYSGWKVTWVVNITDVDDKLIAESALRGTTMAKLAEEMTADYLANLANNVHSCISFVVLRKLVAELRPLLYTVSGYTKVI